jgi:hypothetical protein
LGLVPPQEPWRRVVLWVCVDDRFDCQICCPTDYQIGYHSGPSRTLAVRLVCFERMTCLARSSGAPCIPCLRVPGAARSFDTVPYFIHDSRDQVAVRVQMPMISSLYLEKNRSRKESMMSVLQYNTEQIQDTIPFTHALPGTIEYPQCTYSSDKFHTLSNTNSNSPNGKDRSTNLSIRNPSELSTKNAQNGQLSSR